MIPDELPTAPPPDTIPAPSETKSSVPEVYPDTAPLLPEPGDEFEDTPRQDDFVPPREPLDTDTPGALQGPLGRLIGVVVNAVAGADTKPTEIK